MIKLKDIIDEEMLRENAPSVLKKIKAYLKKEGATTDEVSFSITDGPQIIGVQKEYVPDLMDYLKSLGMFKKYEVKNRPSYVHDELGKMYDIQSEPKKSKLS